MKYFISIGLHIYLEEVIEMIQLYAKAENLSCLINNDNKIETIPEPFRMQENVLFKVTYSEYINFVLSLTLDSKVQLMTPTDVLLNMARTNQPKLYNHFLRDVAFAIIKEVMFAEHYKRRGTVIVPASYNNQNVMVTNMLAMFSQCANAQRELVRHIIQLGYAFPREVSPFNASLFKMSVVLYHMSLSDIPVEEMNVVYDITN